LTIEIADLKMQQIESLDFGNYYHIYNSGIQGSDLFRDQDDYERFLAEYDRYIEPVAETYAWCLMGNHFHVLVRILDEKDIKPFKDLTILNQLKSAGGRLLPLLPLSGPLATDRVVSPTPSVVENPDGSLWNQRKPKPSTQFSHLFNSYAQYFNKKYHRHGILFERRFKRKLVDDIEYLKRLILYIHNNPVHHGFVEHPIEYPWSSYQTCVSITSTKLQREKVVGWFDSEANFKQLHNGKMEIKKLEEWLEL
jgi:putative transposase